ncbi:TetR/AcrR family transcriptional regulator [Zavarzinia sp.]|uniref:TetR/AcrR family transcriptional regulator n=1 Tax=Zavarzinia sp. TaxID=2027920 RepID=UPI003BB4BC3C
MMTEAHRRKKQPIELRQHLLDAAAALSVRAGVGNLRLDAVAGAAGVSKGGLLHHFPSRQALLEALCEECLSRFDRRIEAELAADPVAPGRFSRAYLAVMTGVEVTEQERAWGLLSVVLFAEPEFRDRWSRWLAAHLARHAETDQAPILDIVRLAADGLWLADMSGENTDPARRSAIVTQLRILTLNGREAP